MFSETIVKASFVTPEKEKKRKEVKDLVFKEIKKKVCWIFLNTQNAIIFA